MTTPNANEIRQKMQSVATAVKMQLPPNTAFMVFAFGEDEQGPRCEYVSNGDRLKIIEAMKDWIALQEGKN